MVWRGFDESRYNITSHTLSYKQQAQEIERQKYLAAAMEPVAPPPNPYVTFLQACIAKYGLYICALVGVGETVEDRGLGLTSYPRRPKMRIPASSLTSLLASCPHQVYVILALQRPTVLGFVFMTIVIVGAVLPDFVFRQCAPLLLMYTGCYAVTVYWSVMPRSLILPLGSTLIASAS